MSTPPNPDLLAGRASENRLSDSSTPLRLPEQAGNPFHENDAGPSNWHTSMFDDDTSNHDPPVRDPSIDPNTVSPSRSAVAMSNGNDRSRRPSDKSNTAPYDGYRPDSRKPDKFSFSSYQHPYDIQPPSATYGAQSRPLQQDRRASADSRGSGHHDNISRRSRLYSDDTAVELGQLEETSDPPPPRGVLSGLVGMYNLSHGGSRADVASIMPKAPSETSHPSRGRRLSLPFLGLGNKSPSLEPESSEDSLQSIGYDPDDPKITGSTRVLLDDIDDVEGNVKETMDLKHLNYRQRRKEAAKIRIQFNVTSILNRQKFVIKLARALMTFGAPSHRIESQLVAASRSLEIEAEYIHLPNIVLACFGDPETKTSETHFLKCSGRLALGKLLEVHQIYRRVVHDEISAKAATRLLAELIASPPIYPIWMRCALAFLLSALICPLAFGGSFLDMWVSGCGALALCALQLTVVAKNSLLANVFEITIAILISFLARGLSSIRSEIFCYTAISSAGIVGILPGFLILSSSLELASKNVLTGSVKMVYALIYTLFLGFGLQIGSDFYLLIDSSTRHNLSHLASAMHHTVAFTGMYVADNTTRFDASAPLFGTFAFTNGTSLVQEHIFEGCFRPPWFGWYLQPFPLWTQFIIVPLFSTLSSLANLQPWMTVNMLGMVLISCTSYAANKTANHFIFNRSDVVSAIGAFVVGVLGTLYSRRFAGTAFIVTVTGVLFLVPSGLSQAGGITASGSGIDIGAAMIAVTIGITVGLFMSQAFLGLLGAKKDGAMFSF